MGATYREITLRVFVAPGVGGHRGSLFARVVDGRRTVDRLLGRAIDCADGDVSDLAGIIATLRRAIDEIEASRFTPPR